MAGATALTLGAAALLLGSGAALAATPAQTMAPPGPQTVLRICLDKDNPLNSVKHGKTESGFDLAMAKAVAAEMHRSLAVTWFENEPDEDSVLSQQVDALLSDGRCDLVGGYALTRDGLGEPSAKTSRLPDYDGAKRADRFRQVTLGVLVPSHPYRLEPFTVVLGPKVPARPVTKLSDLGDLKIGSEDGTLSGTIMMLYGGGRLVSQTIHVVPNHGILDGLADGKYQAVLIELSRFDAYRLAHPDSHLKATGYYHSIAFNIGFVGLQRDEALIKSVNRVVDDLMASGKAKALAEQEHLTYVAPRMPAVMGKIPLTAYTGD